MKFTEIDLQKWPRSQIFTYFSSMAPTGYSLTVEVDVTELRAKTRERGEKFFPAYLWLITKCLNCQPEFRLAYESDRLGYYDVLTPLYATFHEDDHTFSLMWTPYDEDYQVFYRQYLENQRIYGGNHGILAQPHLLPPPNAYTVSAVPWIDFQHFAVHSYENKRYFFPSVEAGRIRENAAGRQIMPLSLTCHHAATDGFHIHLFLERLKEEIRRF